MTFSIRDAVTGLPRHFNVDIDTRFVTLEVEGEKPALGEDDLKRMLAEPLNLDLWKELLPPEQFSFVGFGVMRAIDVTLQEVLSALKDDLLQKDAMTTPERVDHLEYRLRTLLRRPDLRLGLIAFQNDGFEGINNARPVGRSLLLSDAVAPRCPHKARSYYAKAFNGTEPVIVEDLAACEVCTGFEYHLRHQGLHNLLVMPLSYEGVTIGLLELASPNPGDVNAVNVRHLMEVVSLFTTAMKRLLEESEDRVQAIIKKQYTAIHPVVEWRFREAAMNYMTAQAEGKAAESESIVFEEVYPLYGLSDIRNSSVQRNEAIQEDLVEQLGLALSVIVQASTEHHLPALDEIGFRISKYVHEIESGLRSGDEATVLEFLRRDVEPLFDELAGLGASVREKAGAYRAAIDPGLGILYRKRKDFEESVMMINDTIGRYLDAQEEQAQAMFPHYFEKYKTDGVDYNVYVGASLQADRRFNMLYLHNLRLWQLMTMCGVVWEMDALQPRLKMPLQTAHLILAQNMPLAIRFREDEKQFDVDGAYNIRYEIIKKRIDKAEIRGTGMRLTQPGMIAIVYAQDRLAQEYRRYIEYLQSAGYLEPEVEDVTLNELQGVSGLRALRVRVAEAPAESDPPLAELLHEAPSGDGIAAPVTAVEPG
jgi:hypothetical protein